MNRSLLILIASLSILSGCRSVAEVDDATYRLVRHGSVVDYHFQTEHVGLIRLPAPVTEWVLRPVTIKNASSIRMLKSGGGVPSAVSIAASARKRPEMGDFRWLIGLDPIVLARGGQTPVTYLYGSARPACAYWQSETDLWLVAREWDTEVVDAYTVVPMTDSVEPVIVPLGEGVTLNDLMERRPWE